jgi:deoxyribonuclease IV
VQVFDSNPRTWRTTPLAEEEAAAARAGLQTHHLPLFVHTIYLINLASPDAQLRERSAEALAGALVMAARIGAAAIVTHVGSHRGDGFVTSAGRVIDSLRLASETAEREIAARVSRVRVPPLLLENGAGSGGTIGADLGELQELLQRSPPDHGVCLDTAHLFAAGYEIHTARGLDQLVKELRQRDLLQRVGLMHFNDSKTDFGSGRDRHANPGEGCIGSDALARVLRHPAFAAVPFILEVPGPDGHGPNAAILAQVKRWRQARAAPREEPAPSAQSSVDQA